MRDIVFLLWLVGICSCSNNSNHVDIQTESNLSDSTKITIVEVNDSRTNFDALLLTNHLSYLRYALQEFNEGHGMDTIKDDSWETVLGSNWRRDTSRARFMIGDRTYTINKEINKVTNFTGSGSGFFANVNFLYDEKARLIMYDDRFLLNYDDASNLIEVVEVKRVHGIKKVIGIIRFTKSTYNKK